ncbi:MAG: SPASM domain-containing protein, partial [Alphaproteobacteria bacterium]|nr:SPASM domain-containing protein [Alphaproteobacteria bacterium]
GYDYVGVSLDGIGPVHDRFRRQDGAYDASLRGIRLCRDLGIKVGLRFTMTEHTVASLPQLLDLIDAEDIDKFYLSHLVYAGRGNRYRGDDAYHRTTRNAMDLIFRRCWDYARRGVAKEFVTGNNDADGVHFLYWVREHFPDRENHIRAKLAAWGGNASGVNVANIDNLGNVHPDTFWWHHTLGNVRERPFSEIWQDRSDPIFDGLKKRPREIKGRCGRCRYFDICGGNTRVRALQLTGDPWEEDPACYLTDSEIGVAGPRRVGMTARRSRDYAAAK